MARRARVHFPGALFHVISRGNQRQRVYKDEEDHGRFEALLGDVIKRHSLTLDAFNPGIQITTTGGAGGAAGIAGGQNGTIYLEQTFASSTPLLQEAPVMNAAAPSNGEAQLAAVVDSCCDVDAETRLAELSARILSELSKVASADRLQRRIFDPAILNPRSSIVEPPANLYLALAQLPYCFDQFGGDRIRKSLVFFKGLL